MFQGLAQKPPTARPMNQIAWLIIAPGKPHPKGGDAQMALSGTGGHRSDEVFPH
jgi:hypothetical protein